MKSKILSLFGLSLFILVVLTSFASAVTLADWSLISDGVTSNVNTNINAGTFTNGTGVSAISFDANGASSSSWPIGVLDANSYFQITLSPKTGYDLTISNINFGEDRSLTTGIRDYTVRWSKSSSFSSFTTIATVPVPDVATERTGDISGLSISVDEGETIYIRWFGYNAEDPAGTWRINDGTLSVQGTVTDSGIPEEITECTDLGNPGDLNVKDIDLSNLGMLQLKNTDSVYVRFGDDDEWFILDDIEVDIEIENDGDENVDDIVVEWGLYDTQANEWIIEMDDEKDFNLKDGKDDVLTISFNLEDDLDIDLEDLDDGDDYRFYVTATGTVDNDTEDDTCATDFETVEIVVESDFVVLSNVDFPESVMCGETVQLTADVWNIGDNDQEDVSVDLISKGIGVDEIVFIGDIDAFEDDKLDFTFVIPEDAEERYYTFTFRVLDEDNDVYENNYDDDESEFTLPFKVEGNCGVSTAQAVVSAVLESGGEAGQELVIKATIINTGDISASYVLSAAGYSGWASSADVVPGTFTLGSGESREVLVTFNVKEDASGEELFNIEVVSGNEVVVRQPVSVEIEAQGVGGFFTGWVVGDNLYLWGLGFFNVVLILAIIFVVVRLMRK